MTQDDVIDLLTAAASVDHRTVGESDVKGWWATLRPDIDRQLGLDAVRIHYATSDQRIMPAHVNNLATTIRRDRAEREKAEEIHQAALAAPNPALGGLPIPTDGKPVWAAYQEGRDGPAINRPCSRCGADVGDPCVNSITDRTARIPCLVRLTGKARIA